MKKTKKSKKNHFTSTKHKEEVILSVSNPSGPRQDIIAGIQQINRLLNYNIEHKNLSPIEVKESSNELRSLYGKLWEMDLK